MLNDFIVNNIPYEQALRWLGLIIIWAMIIEEKLRKIKGPSFFHLITCWILTFGALLAFSLVGYIFAILSIFVTIYSIGYSIKRWLRKKRSNG